jgi:hypothetical protein
MPQLPELQRVSHRRIQAKKVAASALMAQRRVVACYWQVAPTQMEE